VFINVTKKTVHNSCKTVFSTSGLNYMQLHNRQKKKFMQ